MPLKLTKVSFQLLIQVELEVSALNGGYIVHPAAAGPASTKSEAIIIADEIKNNQYEIIFKNPEAISLAPICKWN